MAPVWPGIWGPGDGSIHASTFHLPGRAEEGKGNKIQAVCSPSRSRSSWTRLPPQFRLRKGKKFGRSTVQPAHFLPATGAELPPTPPLSPPPPAEATPPTSAGRPRPPPRIGSAHAVFQVGAQRGLSWGLGAFFRTD